MLSQQLQEIIEEENYKEENPVITFNSDDSNKEYKSSDRTIEGADS